MEFKFNVNDILKEPIVEINQNLIPPGFSGDRRALWDTVGKVSEIVNAMGEASATAQGLTKPITTAERVRNSEHKIFFLTDQAANNGKGAVIGMLKTGKKGLYVFDKEGQHYQVSPPCILDFYIHESRQRAGLGKQLFEHMLKKEEIEPVKMAIDRPSDKLLGFLNKHYSLNSPVKQMNNFVVFDDFFPKTSEKNNTIDSDKSGDLKKKESANGLQSLSSPYGRYGAPRPPCSMGQIIHNQTSTINKGQEPTGVQSLPATNYQGMQNGSPNPNEPYTTQSVPNTNYGDRMLNNAAMANNNQYQNQLHQANGYNQQHMENIMPAQNQMIGQNQFPMNYQHYNTSTQPTANGIIQNLDNQQSAPHPNNAAVSAHNTYSVQGQYLTPTQVHSLQNNANQMATHTATGVYNQAQNAHGSQDEVPNMTYQNDQQALHQNKLEPQPPANWSTPNVAYSQPAINAQTYAMTPQYQNVNQMNANTVPQSFANLNNQFSNMDNQAPNQQYGLNNAVVTPQPSFSNIQGASGQMVNMPSVNTGVTNAQHSENSNMIHTSQTMVPNNYIQPQAYVNNNNNMQSQNQWSQQNYQNIPQYQNANLDIRTNIPTNYNNVLHAGMIPSNQNLNPNAPQISQLQTLTNNQSRQPIDTSSVPQNIPAAEPHIHLNQPSQQLVTGNHEASASIQQLPSLNQQNDNMKRIVSSPTISVPYGHHTNQTYIQSVPNIPQQLVQPTYQNYNTNPITNQAYNSQNQNMATKIASNHNQHVPQASYSARNVTNSAEMQISQHNVPINHSVPNVPNMSHGDFIQPNLPNVNAVPEKNRNNDLNNVKQTEEVNRNHGKGDAKAMEEEGSLPYGYPPQLHSVNDDQTDKKIHFSPKLERPRSLSIQQSEEHLEENQSKDENTKDADKTEENEAPKEVEIENKKTGKITQMLPATEEVDNIAMGRKTPSHLTEQGFLDLKFYHNRLW